MLQEFQGLEGQKMPIIPEDFIVQISERYIELFESITGQNFVKEDLTNIELRIKQNIDAFLA